MATTITGRLNKAATQFQAGESVGFGLRIGVKYYDRDTKADAWTNYEVAIFAKAPAQVQFYQQALVEGAIVEVTGDKQRIRQFQGANGLQLSIEILDAKLGFVGTPSLPQQQNMPQQQQQQRPAPQQQAYNQQQRPQQAYQPAQQQHYHQQAQQPYNQAPQQPYNHNPNVATMNGQAQNLDFSDDIPF